MRHVLGDMRIERNEVLRILLHASGMSLCVRGDLLTAHPCAASVAGSCRKRINKDRG